MVSEDLTLNHELKFNFHINTSHLICNSNNYSPYYKHIDCILVSYIGDLCLIHMSTVVLGLIACYSLYTHYYRPVTVVMQCRPFLCRSHHSSHFTGFIKLLCGWSDEFLNEEIPRNEKINCVFLFFFKLTPEELQLNQFRLSHPLDHLSRFNNQY